MLEPGEAVPYQPEFEVPGCVLIMSFMDGSRACLKTGQKHLKSLGQPSL